jgi:hypothetical protein
MLGLVAKDLEGNLAAMAVRREPDR